MKEKKVTLIPDIKVMHFEPDEGDHLPEMKRVVEDGPRYRGKTVPELKKMAKVLVQVELHLPDLEDDEIFRVSEDDVREFFGDLVYEDRLNIISWSEC